MIKKIKNIFKKSKNNKVFGDLEFLERLPYKTPFFLISKKKIVENLQEFDKVFPKPLIQYAMKANSEPEVLQTILDAGVGFEVASMYELDLLKKIKVPPSRIVYGTSVKPIEHIKEFVKYGVDRFAFDSFPELEKIVSVAPKAKVYVRTIANDAGSVFKFSEKFGTDTASIIPLLLRARELGLHPYGISFHVGSQASDVRAWADVIRSLRSIIQDLKEMDVTLDVLNLGGGFPCRYLSGDTIPTLKDIARYSIEQYVKLPYQPQIMVEPGRGIIADTAVLIASVIARVERRGNTWLFLDAGVYNGLFETMAYQGSTRYPITSMRPVGNAGEMLFAIAGPTGDSPDVITKEALLPQDMAIGDKVIVHQTGAYSLSVTSEFNGFPKPPAYYT